MLESKKRNGTLNPNNPERTATALATKRARGTIYNSTAESKAKALATKQANGTTNANTADSIPKRLATRIAKGTDVKVCCEICGQSVSKFRLPLHQRSAKCKNNALIS